MTDEIEIRKLPLFDRRRIEWATQRRERANPHWGKSNEEVMIDKLREEMRAVASRGASTMNDNDGKPVVHDLVAADLVVGSPTTSEPLRKRSPRKPSLATELKHAAEAGFTVTGVTTDPEGRRTLHFGEAHDSEEAQDARVVAFRRIAKMREGNG